MGHICDPMFGHVLKVLEKIVLLLLVDVVTLFSTDTRATKFQLTLTIVDKSLNGCDRDFFPVCFSLCESSSAFGIISGLPDNLRVYLGINSCENNYFSIPIHN